MQIFQVRLTPVRLALLALLIALSCGAAAAVVVLMPPTYSAEADVVLIGPSIGTDGKATNPYLDFSDALPVTADTISLASSSDATVKKVVAAGGTNEYTIARTLGSSEPILVITGKAPTAAQAIKTTNLVRQALFTELKSRQNNVAVAPDLQVRLVTIVQPEKAKRVWKTPLEIGIALLVVGIVTSLLILVFVDRYLARRESRGGSKRRFARLRARTPKITAPSIKAPKLKRARKDSETGPAPDADSDDHVTEEDDLLEEELDLERVRDESRSSLLGPHTH